MRIHPRFMGTVTFSPDVANVVEGQGRKLIEDVIGAGPSSLHVHYEQDKVTLKMQTRVDSAAEEETILRPTDYEFYLKAASLACRRAEMKRAF